MATVAPTLTRLQTFGDNATVVAWTPLTTTNADGGPFAMPGWADRSVQIGGTFGVGGTVVIEGSIDGTNYITLTDPQGNGISKTAAAIEAISELVRFLRPRVTAGDGTTSITVTMIARRP
jgi:hypothetical protein